MRLMAGKRIAYPLVRRRAPGPVGRLVNTALQSVVLPGLGPGVDVLAVDPQAGRAQELVSACGIIAGDLDSPHGVVDVE